MKRVFFVLAFLILACGLLLAADEAVTKRCEGAAPTPIKDIRANPSKFVGKWALVKGEYEGWDVNHRLKEGPPVTRSDWIVYDQSAAIYVSAKGGDEYVRLRMQKIEKIGQKLTLCGLVEKNERGQVYLKLAEGAWLEVEELQPAPQTEQVPAAPPIKRR